MAISRQKLYTYVNESGQDTAGRFFVVGALPEADCLHFREGGVATSEE
jgi:hypothetical protein